MPFGISAAGWVALGTAAVGTAVAASSAEDAEDAQHAATQAGIATTQDSQALQREQFDRSMAFQREQYDNAQRQQQPFLQAGTGAVNKLAELLGVNGQPGTLQNDFKFDSGNLASDPGYQFQLEQGQNALSRRQAAGGGFYSGAALQDASRLNQGLASTAFGDAYNRQFNEFQTERANQLNPLQSLAGQGQTQANQSAANGASFANAAGALGSNYANASTGINNSLAGLLTNQGNATGAAGIAQGNALLGGLNNGVTAWQRQQYLNQGSGTAGAYGGGTVPGGAFGNYMGDYNALAYQP